MEETNIMDERLKSKVEEKVVDRISTNYKVTNDITTFISRIEALNIIVAVINAFLGERQGSENKLTDAEVAAIQNAINIENAKTDKLFQEIDAVMNKIKSQ